MNINIEIYTDGSSLGNPGPGGFGVVFIQNNKIIKELGGSDKNTTNNKMELKAVIEALIYIKKSKLDIKKSQFKIFTDSSYVLGGVTTWVSNWENNGWKTANKKPVLNQVLWQELIELSRNIGVNLSWQKVKGHSGDLYNDRADEIATQNAMLEK